MLRCLWVDDPKKENRKIIHYMWTRLAFGLTCSPFILRAVIIHHLDSKKAEFDRVKRILERLYVDDWMGGANDSELTDVTKKALGILWDPVKDEFLFNTKHMENELEKTKNAITKRTLFSLGSKIFDPVGYVLPVTMQARLVMQKIWSDPTKWDEYVTPQILKNWNGFITGLDGLETVRIPRWTGIKYDEPYEIHIFCDASEDAYAAVPYQVQGNKSTLIASKARVAPSPKRSTTIPRLELLANLIASTLAKYLKRELIGL